MDTTSPSPEICDILSTIYPQVQTLLNFYSTIDNVVQCNDSDRFKTFMASTVVATPQNVKPLPENVTQVVSFLQHEVINRAISNIAKSQGLGRDRYLQTEGYHIQSEHFEGSMSSCLGDLESANPNWNVLCLQSPMWEKLLTRIGSDRMLHLIEHFALFIAADRCYIQIAGMPVVRMLPSVSNITVKPDRKRKRRDSDDYQTMPCIKTSNVVAAKSTNKIPEEKGQSTSPGSYGHGVVSFEPANQVKKRRNAKKRERKKRKAIQRDVVEEPGPPFKHSMCADRRSLFFSGGQIEELIKRDFFILEPSHQGAEELFVNIFVNCDVGEAVPVSDNEMEILKSNVDALLLKLLKNHKKCPYKFLLRYYSKMSNDRNTQIAQLSDDIDASKDACGEPEQTQMETNVDPKTSPKKPKVSVQELLQESLNHSDVYRFFRNIIRRVVPAELFGNSVNAFMSALCTFVDLGRGERFCLGMLMRQIKDASFSWLAGIARPRLRRNLAARFLWWLLTQFVVPVVRSFFYVTDASSWERRRALYFRKRTWTRMVQKTIAGYESNGMLERISKEAVREKLATGQALGVSPLRFLPKTNSLRPIVRMSKPPAEKKGRSINKKLQNLHSVLARCQEEQPQHFGCAISGINGIYDRWSKFLQNRAQKNDARPLFFVKADIAKCYDTIKPEIVLERVRTVLGESEGSYVVRSWASVKRSRNTLIRRFHRNSSPTSQFIPNFRAFINKHLKNHPSPPDLVLDQVFNIYENRNSLLKSLEAHLFHNIIQMGNQYFLQKMGIGQGSVLSSLLCNLYYADMERTTLKGKICLEEDCRCEIRQKFSSTDKQTSETDGICGTDELLLRIVDDYLFVTPYLSHAQQFLSLLTRGIPEYNCRINVQKTLVNFPSRIPGVEQAPRNAWFPWCGIQIHTETLCVQTDYSRHKGNRIRDAMTLDTVQNPGVRLRQMVHKTVCTQVHSICFDPAINSVSVICMNLYRIFILAALKFHANTKILKRPPKLNPQFFLTTILRLPRLVCSQIETKFKSRNSAVLKYEPIAWLCVVAFRSKLEMHQGAYQSIIQGLRRAQKRLKIDAAVLPLLEQTVKEGIPRDFALVLD